MKNLSPKVGVGCILINKDKILLGRRKGSHGDGQWAPPGGHLDHGELVEMCARRELEEETGLIAGDTSMGPWVEYLVENENKHYITLFVIMKYVEGEALLLEPGKCLGWSWHSLDKLPQPLFPPLKSLVDMNFFKETNL